MKVDIICMVCGNSFQDYPNRGRKYCSQECSWIGKTGKPSPRKGTHVSSEARENIIKGIIGRKHSEETKRKMSDARRGKHLSAETCKRISESKLGKHVESSTQFKKGQVSWNKGRAMSDDSKLKISKANRGRKLTEEHKKQISDKLRNREFSAEHKKRIAIAKNGQILSDEAKAKISKSRIGQRLSEETKQKISKANIGKKYPRHSELFSGDKNPNWRGGKSFEPYCPKFNKQFKQRIKEKFNKICYLCPSETGGIRLYTHHIDYNKNSICNGKEWAFVPLCGRCHTRTNFNRWYWFNLLINYWAVNPEINFSGEINGRIEPYSYNLLVDRK